eukprot:TRINITY_DN74552_c0_g1_i1.p1 TRINITY_DN74552_c0_g1~~TRINITY_DN74552_c0_g1_i1.p1  ORF type:complete len:187 (+),score=45.74 TRINITY_DN74552_c0_g1_i1:3-563(+)
MTFLRSFSHSYINSNEFIKLMFSRFWLGSFPMARIGFLRKWHKDKLDPDDSKGVMKETVINNDEYVPPSMSAKKKKKYSIIRELKEEKAKEEAALKAKQEAEKTGEHRQSGAIKATVAGPVAIRKLETTLVDPTRKSVPAGEVDDEEEEDEKKTNGVEHSVKTGEEEIGRAVQQECRDRSRMPSSA